MKIMAKSIPALLLTWLLFLGGCAQLWFPEQRAVEHYVSAMSYHVAEQDFLAIPYYAWAHRGEGEMVVWLPRGESAAKPLPGRTIASTSRITVSRGGDVAALNDQYEPKDSNDHSNRFFHWWPRKGTEEWVQYDFKRKEKISAVEVYWFDDTGRGECRIPESWRLMYREGDLWKPVANASPFGVAKDTFNRTTFEPVETNGLRLVVQLPPNFSTGIHEWRVE